MTTPLQDVDFRVFDDQRSASSTIHEVDEELEQEKGEHHESELIAISTETPVPELVAHALHCVGSSPALGDKQREVSIVLVQSGQSSSREGLGSPIVTSPDAPPVPTSLPPIRRPPAHKASSVRYVRPPELPFVGAYSLTSEVGRRFQPAEEPPCTSPLMYSNPFGAAPIGNANFMQSTVSQRASSSATELLNDLYYNDVNSNHQQRWSYASPADKASVLQMHLDKVQSQFHMLQRKHNEVDAKYNRAIADLEHYRTAAHQLEMSLQDAKAIIANMQSDRDISSHHKDLLEQELRDLELRAQQADAEASDARLQCQQLLEGGFPASAALALENCESLRRDKERLRQDYALLETHHVSLQDELSACREDVHILRRQVEQECQEKNKTVVQERENHQSLMAAYAQLHKMAQERELLERTAETWKAKYEEARMEVERLLMLRAQQDDEIRRMKTQKDATAFEYSRVMGERDTILKENERYHEEKTALLKKMEALEIDRHSFLEQVKELQCEIAAIKADEQEKSTADLYGRRLTNGDDTTSVDEYSRGVAESFDSSSCCSAEIVTINAGKDGRGARLLEELRGQLEHVKMDMEKVRQDRDWAMNEREKIVSERDSQRVIADTLRKERDEANTRLGRAIKDLDELKRQREEAEKDAKEIKERFELELQLQAKNGRSSTATGGQTARGGDGESSPSHASCDSAIEIDGADVAEWEVETLTHNLGGCSKESSLGLELGGGRDEVVNGTFVPIYVKSVVPGSKFDGVLRLFDCILQVNNIDVANMEKRSVMDILKNSKQCKMVVRRRRLVGMKLISVPFELSDCGDLGLSFEDGVYVGKIRLNSPAAKQGNVAPGDRIVYVNSVPVNGKRASEVQEIVREYASSGVVLAVTKTPPLLSPMTPSAALPLGAVYPMAPSAFARKSSGTLCDSSGTTPFPSQFAADEPPCEVTPSSSGCSSSAPTPAMSVPKKHFLDRIHERIFSGRSEKKPIKAAGTVSAEAQPTTAAEMHAGAAPPWRNGPRLWTKSSSSGAGGSVAPISPMRPFEAISEEQEALGKLDEVLEPEFTDGGRTLTQKSFEKFQRNVQPSTGGTWPKYRPSAGAELEAPMNVVAQRGSDYCQGGSQHRTHRQQRRHVLTVFDSASVPASPAKSTTYELSRPSSKASDSSSRPMSYHSSMQDHRTDYRTPHSIPRSLAIDAKYYRKRGAQANFVRERPETQVASAHPLATSSPKYGRTGVASPAYSDDVRRFSSPYDERGTPESLSAGSACSVHGSDFSTGPNGELAQRATSGEIRRMRIVCGSSHEKLGISVLDGNTGGGGGGIFIASVAPHSLAARHGILAGDQLLEICGINLRQASHHAAKQVLNNISTKSEEITLEVQYNPEKYRELAGGVSSRLSQATPASSLSKTFSKESFGPLSTSTAPSTVHTNSRDLLLSDMSVSMGHHHHQQPRYVSLKKSASSWGISLFGGNHVGIFVDEVKETSHAAGPDGLRCGDQILEFNCNDFRKVTMEQAMEELQRPCDGEVTFLVQYNEKQYTHWKRVLQLGGGDSLYVRALFDRTVDNRDEMSFRAGDILYVDNTCFNKQAGLWRAWLVDEQGRQRCCGVIPSKSRLEDEKRASELTQTSLDGGGSESGSRRGTIRRSLKFIRRSARSSTTAQHQRTPSRESQENATATVDAAAMLLLDDHLFYQRVNRIDYTYRRPLVVLGPLAECFAERLQEDSPQLFKRCVPETLPPSVSSASLDDALLAGKYVDCRRREKLFEVISSAAVTHIMEQNYHCILDVSPAAVERLHRLKIYPVVVFVKFKHAKQLKELKDAPRFSDHVVNSKQAKELFELAAKLEHDFKELFTEVVNVQTNYGVKFICQQVQSVVEHEQKKTLWIASKEQL